MVPPLDGVGRVVVFCFFKINIQVIVAVVKAENWGVVWNRQRVLYIKGDSSDVVTLYRKLKIFTNVVVDEGSDQSRSFLFFFFVFFW